jgi:hypothetical protein
MREVIRQKDPLTGELFFPKRANQKFARPENRIKFNNDAATALRRERSFLDKHVHKNQLILREIFVEGKDNVFDNMWLLGKGLRNDATNHQVIYLGVVRNCVYEFILVPIENTNKTKIVKLKI